MARTRMIAIALLLGLPTAAAARGGYITIKTVHMARPKVVHRKKPAPKPRARVVPPGPADAGSLGFGSTAADVERLLGKPEKVVKANFKEIWHYGLSTVTLGKGRVIAWSTYDKPLPVNIGAAVPGAKPVKTGGTMKQLVAYKGTPNSVAVYGGAHLWTYGMVTYTFRNGTLIPTVAVTIDVNPSAKDTAKPKTAKPGQPTGGGGGRCYCPL